MYRASRKAVSASIIIQEVIDLLKQQWQAKELQIQFQPFEEFVWMDPDHLKLVVRNLLSNAIKFTKEGGNIEIYTMRNKRNAFVIIKDNGLGISTENLEKLFRDDVTFSTFGTDNEKGIGLGLVLCKDFMNMQNGSIEIESIVDEGTTVNLLFPLVGRE